MTYKEFLKSVEEILKRNTFKTSTPSHVDVIYCTREIGGMSGGNCWGGQATPYSCNEQAEIVDLDKILESLCPNITFLEYKSLGNNLIQFDSRSDGDYYGNGTDYEIKYIELKKLYNYLNEKGFLDNA